MPKPRWRLRATSIVPLLIGLIAGACVFDPDQRCGPAMTFNQAVGACVCDGNAIAVTGGCRACASDEIASGGKCVCAAGQTRSAGNVCVPVAGLGDPCNATSAPCTDTTYSYCAVRGSASTGTCTRTCSSHTDCDAAYTCATWEAQPYCRTFESAGKACTSSAECTGDATYCDTYMTHSCIVRGCSLTANDCPRGTMCCDFSRFGLGTVCAGACP